MHFRDKELSCLELYAMYKELNLEQETITFFFFFFPQRQDLVINPQGKSSTSTLLSSLSLRHLWQK